MKEKKGRHQPSIKDRLKRIIVNTFTYRILDVFREHFLKLAMLPVFAKWCKVHLSSPYIELNNSREELYEYVGTTQALDKSAIVYLEFGVYKGDSFQWWLQFNKNSGSNFVGFDTFTGLPEDWGKSLKGSYHPGDNAPKAIDSRAKFIKGLYQDTLRGWIDKNQALFLHPLKVIHMDSDLYSSTLFVLATMHEYFRKGDILIFDDFNCVWHEFRAFHDFSLAYRLDYSLVGAVNTWRNVAIMINKTVPDINS